MFHTRERAMTDRPLYLMTDPACFDVCYQINPWMRPDAWKADSAACLDADRPRDATSAASAA